MKEWLEFNPQEVSPEHVEQFLLSVLAAIPNLHAALTPKVLNKLIDQQRKTFKFVPSKSDLAGAYHRLLSRSLISPNETLLSLLVKKSVRSTSGVLVITVLTAPGPFSCPKDCHYCPNEPGQPRSYLSTEPAVLRANQNGWDAVSQFFDRANTLENNGHIVDKMEILVLGGTWSGYPRDYQEEFVRDLFYAANVFDEMSDAKERKDFGEEREEGEVREGEEKGRWGVRAPLSLLEEQKLNETSKHRIIGLTLETRPDYVNAFEIRNLRRLGCTRVQIGIQHTNDQILDYINRDCTLKQVKNAVALLKNSGFKVDGHLMPDLPSSTYDLDVEMFEEMLYNPELQLDQWKVYPCEITPFSKIEEWYHQKKFIPYTEENNELLVKLLIDMKVKMHPWIRLNRIIRDIPNPSIIGGNQITNLRQVLETIMKEQGLTCRCIRCREVRTATIDVERLRLKRRDYVSSGGLEVFLSFETEDEKTILGFLRLRLGNAKSLMGGNSVLPELSHGALIRELHVYGNLVGVREEEKGEKKKGKKGKKRGGEEEKEREVRVEEEVRVEGEEKREETVVGGNTDLEQSARSVEEGRRDGAQQHLGLGRKLLLAAEKIALDFGHRKISVISGIGVREYYKKNGYEQTGSFLAKYIHPSRYFTCGEFAEAKQHYDSFVLSLSPAKETVWCEQYENMMPISDSSLFSVHEKLRIDDYEIFKLPQGYFNSITFDQLFPQGENHSQNAYLRKTFLVKKSAESSDDEASLPDLQNANTRANSNEVANANANANKCCGDVNEKECCGDFSESESGCCGQGNGCCGNSSDGDISGCCGEGIGCCGKESDDEAGCCGGANEANNCCGGASDANNCCGCADEAENCCGGANTCGVSTNDVTVRKTKREISKRGKGEKGQIVQDLKEIASMSWDLLKIKTREHKREVTILGGSVALLTGVYALTRLFKK